MGFQRMEQEVPASAARDRLGRWRDGVSGNPAGRPRGSKNKKQRRAGDRERAAHWTRHDWHTLYKRAFHESKGDTGQKQGAAISECIGVWLLLNPPIQRSGLCTHCGKTLDLPMSSINGAPVRADGAWLHWSCLPPFLRDRWNTAKVGLQRLGIEVGQV
jgi:hypothetical protein